MESGMSDGHEHAMRVGAIMRHRVGGWLPADQDALEEWLAGLKSTVEEREEPAGGCPVGRGTLTAVPV